MIAKHGENRFDILRLTAAWLVIFSHSYPLSGAPHGDPLTWISTLDTLGGVGVITFFALSGYLVTLSLGRSDNLLIFAWHRSLRIYPALIGVCAVTVLVLGPAVTKLPIEEYFSNPETWNYLRNAAAFSVRYQLPGVFEDVPVAKVINGSLWSLPVEVRCYIALALVGLLPGALRYKAAIMAAALLAVYLLRPAPVAPADAFEKFFGLDYQYTKLGLVFAMGAVYGSWGNRIRPMFWPAAVLLGLAVFLPKGSLATACFLLGLGTMVLWLALHAMWLPRIPERMGDWSYGLFLYGFPVQQLLAHYGVPRLGIVAYILAATIAGLACAALSWHLLEKRALVLRRWVRTGVVPASAPTT